MSTLLDGYNLLHEGTLALAECERAGLRIDVEYCREKLAWIDEQGSRSVRRLRLSVLGKAWQARFGIDETADWWNQFSKNGQLQVVLYADLKVKSFKKTTSDQDSVDEESLRYAGVDGIDHLLRLRSLKKMRDVLGQFVQHQIDGYLYPTFGLHTVATYRSSGSSPNLQNVPNRDPEQMAVCRRAIVPSPGNVLLEIDFSGIEVSVAACVTGDTEIETLGRRRTVLEIIDELSTGEPIYVYGYDREKGRIALSRINDAGITRRRAEVWKVTLDNRESIRATPDHKFMLRTGEYIRLDQLSPGSSLMPLYRKVKKGSGKQGKRVVYYRDVYLNNGDHIWEHNLVALDVFGTQIKGSSLLVHHDDGNGCNNDPSNLEVMTRMKHMQLHSIQGWENNREGHVENHWTKTEEGHRRVSEMNYKRAELLTESDRAEFGRRVSEGIRRNGGRSGKRNSMYGRRHSEETLARISESRLANPTEPWCKGFSKETNETLANAVEKMIATKRANLRPAWNKGEKGLYVTSEETKRKLSEAMKDRVFSDETRGLLSANKSEYWAQRERGDVECKLCGGMYTTITNTHLRHRHGITSDEYRSLTANHKVVSIEFSGYEDVYNLDVEGIHNYAVGAGVVLKNCYHKDPTMIAYLRDPASDMHGDTAKDLFFLKGRVADLKKLPGFSSVLRQAAKNSFVFPQFYGDYYESCAPGIACGWCKLPRVGDWTEEDGAEFDGRRVGEIMIQNDVRGLVDFTEHVRKVERVFWDERFPVYSRWKREFYSRYQRRGSIQMKTGFTCGGAMVRNQAVNYPVQGPAFHLLLRTLIWVVQRIRGWKSRVVGEVHDSLLVDANPAEVAAIVEMVNRIASEDLPKLWSWIIVPLRVEAKQSQVDGSWAEMKVYEG